jgi:hypothetical protein
MRPRPFFPEWRHRTRAGTDRPVRGSRLIDALQGVEQSCGYYSNRVVWASAPIIRTDTRANDNPWRVGGAPWDIAPPAPFRSLGRRRHPETLISRLDSLACRQPLTNSSAALADDHAWPGATVVRYPFGVGLCHSFVHAGSPRQSRMSRPNDGDRPGSAHTYRHVGDRLGHGRAPCDPRPARSCVRRSVSP